MVKKIVVAVLCLIVAGGYYVGYRSVHADTAHKEPAKQAAAGAQAAKGGQAQQLQAKLEAAWRQAMTAAPPDGNVDIAVYDSKTGATAHYANTTGTLPTASAVKLSILGALLWRDQRQGLSGLTSDQLEEAAPMIENSDNDAATELYLAAGGTAGLNAYFKKIGTTRSTAGDHWGLTQTTAPDQLKVMNAIAYPGAVLTAASAGQANSLMNHVEPDQRWGVTGGVPAGVTVQLKNGWLADSDDGNGWIVNSIGHVHGNGADYTIAVLTDNDQAMQDGINTIQALSTIAWNMVSAAAP